MLVSTRRHGDALVIQPMEPRLDAAVAISFKDAVRSAAQEPGTPVILDMSNVEFLDSSGLGALVAVMKRLGAERPLELAALSPAVTRVFRLTRMDSVFTINDEAPPANTSAQHAVG